MKQLHFAATLICMILAISLVDAAAPEPICPAPERPDTKTLLEQTMARSQSGESPAAQGVYTPFFPAASPNNPEYLVRTIVFIPDNRWPVDQTAREAYIENFRSRLEVFYNFMEQYYEAEFSTYGLPPLAANFERDAGGNIVIHPYHGAEDHNFYWGDDDNDGIIGEPEDTGLNDFNIWASTFNECFGQPGMNIYAESQKIIVVVISDCAEYLAQIPSASNLPGWGGLVGGGSQWFNGDKGYGGYFHISAAFINYLPANDADWATAICDDTINHTQTGGNPVMNNSPAGAFLSEQIGTYLHEFGHALGLWHPVEAAGMDPVSPIMGLGWTSAASAVRRTLSLAPCGGSYTVSDNESNLRRVDCARLHPSRYFNDQTWTEFVNPFAAISWPRLGKVLDNTGGAPYIYIMGQDDHSGMHNLTLARHANMFFDHFDAVDIANGPLLVNDGGITGADLFFTNSQFTTLLLQGMDNEGQQGHSSTFDTRWFTRLVSHDCIVDSIYFVDTDASDDMGGCPEGSFNNPMQDIQAAINAAADNSAVVLMPGVYNISTPIVLKHGVSLLGYGSPEEVILDGGGQNINLIEFTTQAGLIVGHLTLQNANWGINKTQAVWSGQGDFVSLIIKGMAQGGLNISNIEASRIFNCTFYNIAGKAIDAANLWVANQQDFCNALIKHNIFMNCQTGMEVTASPLLVNPATQRISHNLFFNCTAPMAGTGFPYSFYTGHLSADPIFLDAEGGDFRLDDFSPAVWSGDPIYLDMDGTRTRSLGAVEYVGIGPTAARDEWRLYY